MALLQSVFLARRVLRLRLRVHALRPPRLPQRLLGRVPRKDVISMPFLQYSLSRDQNMAVVDGVDYVFTPNTPAAAGCGACEWDTRRICGRIGRNRCIGRDRGDGRTGYWKLAPKPGGKV